MSRFGSRYYGRGAPRGRDDRDRRGPPPRFGCSLPERRYDERRFLKEIATKSLILSTKKFYLDVVEGANSKLLKISEVSPTGQKSKMIMDMSVAVEFHDKISDFCEFISAIDKSVEKDKSIRSEPLKSDTMIKEHRKYYLDLMENHRGVFLKVTMRSPTTDRIQLVFPGSGLPDVRDALTDLLSEHNTDKLESSDDQVPFSPSRREPEEFGIQLNRSQNNNDGGDRPSKKRKISETDEDCMRVVSDSEAADENVNKIKCSDRSFLFEVKKNETGTYLSITETGSKFRSVINVPEKHWLDFVSNVEEKILELRGGHGTDAVELDPIDVDDESSVVFLE